MFARSVSKRLRLPVALPVLVFATFAYAATASTVSAQPAPSTSLSAGVSTSAGQAGVNGQVGFQKTANVPPGQAMAAAQAIITRIEAGSAGIAKQLGAARESHDVVKTLFLSDKLSQIDVTLRSARERTSSLQTAIARNDTELVNHEMTILTVLKQRADQLVSEANQAVGGDMAFTGETSTTETIDPSVPSATDTNDPTADPPIVSGPPLPTSGDK